jgi:hypothetical protein
MPRLDRRRTMTDVATPAERALLLLLEELVNPLRVALTLAPLSHADLEQAFLAQIRQVQAADQQARGA